MIVPNPSTYRDGLIYFRDMHKLILHNCMELERLLANATDGGIAKNVSVNPEWHDLLHFFTHVTVHHEKDEERFLFPLLTSRMPHIGFQASDSPIRFLVEGHEMLTNRTAQLMAAWRGLRTHDLSNVSLTHSAQHHAHQDTEFVTMGHELVALYRKHIALEEEKVYQTADQILGVEDRAKLIQDLINEYDNEATTQTATFDTPQYSVPGYNVQYSTEAFGDAMQSGDDDGDEDGNGDDTDLL